jgi:hypothetical protein
MIVSENQLDEWVRANSEDAQGLIVELVLRLVAASCPRPRERRFPLGDSIGQHGPDGVLDVDLSFEPWVPEGPSYWQIGSGLRASTKATSDYNGVTAATPENVRLGATFVFVTPLSGRRDWKFTWKGGQQAKWLQDRRIAAQWKDVRIIDGTKLVDWVRQFPAVELWLAAKTIGIPEHQITTPEQHWSVVRSTGEPPPLKPDLFLANRGEGCAKVGEIFDGTSTQARLVTLYPDQVATFVAACVASLDRERRMEIAGRCLIVSGEEAWNAVCTQYGKLILVADAALNLTGEQGARLLQAAVRAGHAVVFGGPDGAAPSPISARLPMPSINQVREVLQNTGYSEERARILAHDSGGNLASLLRLVQGLSVVPEWTRWTEASGLAAALILGHWDDRSAGDRDVVGQLSGETYSNWSEKMRALALRPASPLVHSGGRWHFVPRYEGWHGLGPMLFDEHLQRLRIAAASVLRENDPQFDLPTEERYAAGIHGKVLSRSRILRRGLAEALALLGSHPTALTSCSTDTAETTAALSVREILADADWVLWASLNDVLPMLAEAAPREFLKAVEAALQSDPCPFDELYSQESGGLSGRTYISGLLWALETLAWDGNYLSRVVICLGELAARDPGGQWANRPANSLTTILLPWLPQTCAPIDKRVTAVKTLLTEIPEIGWKLVLSVLHQQHGVSPRTARPVWRATIPDDWRDGVTHREYWEQVSAYAELAINEAMADPSKLIELIDHVDNLSQRASEQLLDYIGSDAVTDLPEETRERIWNKLVTLAAQHRKFADSGWAMRSGQIDKIASVADRITPDSPLFRHRRLFSERDFELYERRGDYSEQSRELERRRVDAVREVAESGGAHSVVSFAQTVESPRRVGIAFGAAAGPEDDGVVLPILVGAEDKNLELFAEGYVLGRFSMAGWEWVDSLCVSSWDVEQAGQFFALLPFTTETWKRVERILGEQQSAYWSRTTASPYEPDTELKIAVGELTEHGRPLAAVRCLHSMLCKNQPIDSRKAVQALLEALSSSETVHSLHIYDIVGVIRALQNDPGIDVEDLCRVEWAYLGILDDHHEASPTLLWRRLADEPRFFCAVVRSAFGSDTSEPLAEELVEKRKAVTANAYRLLREWRIPPGLQEDGSYDGSALVTWLQTVKADCSETGHLEIAMQMVGHALTHVPADEEGLWMHRSAAEVLNAKDAQDIRVGFSTQLLNSRGAHWVDPTGRPEKELAAKYRDQADRIESAGYHRLADTLRVLADTYEREAERIASRGHLDDL